MGLQHTRISGDFSCWPECVAPGTPRMEINDANQANRTNGCPRCRGRFCLHNRSALAADVGVSVSVGQPGFYGRIDIGNFPQPRVIYARPIVIQPVPVAVAPQPIYLHVPPGHAKNWRKHCHKYNACNQPAYFVREEWYNNVYVPDYQAKHQGKGHGKGHKDD